MNEGPQNVSFKKNQFLSYGVGCLLIVFSIAYWAISPDSNSPTLINKMSLPNEWLLPAHLFFTFLGLFLIFTSGYSKEIGKSLSLRFYNFVIILRERQIGNFVSSKKGQSQDPLFSTYNLLKVLLIILLAILSLSVLFRFMSKITVIPNIAILWIIIITPIYLIWINLKRLGSSDYKTLQQGKFKEYDCSNGTGAIKVFDNQIAYVKVSDNAYKLLSVGQTEIVSGTTCRIFDQSFFHVKKDALRLHSDLKSDGSEMTISIEISPIFRNFPNLIDKKNYEFNSFFLSDNLDHQLYSMIPHELLSKANMAKNSSLKNLHELVLPEGKSEAEVNAITSNLFNKEVYIQISTQIRAALIKSFNEALNADSAFNITIELDDKLDRATFSREVKRKVEEYLERERQRRLTLERDELDYTRTLKRDLLMLVKAQIEKGTLNPQNQDALMGYVNNMVIQDQRHLSNVEIEKMSKNDIYLEFYSIELIEAHDYILNHQVDSYESKIEYLQDKSFFKEYPRIKPQDVYNKIIEMDQTRREEKMKEALRELINSNKIVNG